MNESSRNVEHVSRVKPALETRLSVLHIVVRKVPTTLSRQLILVALRSINLPILSAFDLEKKGINVVPMRSKAGTSCRGQVRVSSNETSEDLLKNLAQVPDVIIESLGIGQLDGSSLLTVIIFENQVVEIPSNEP